MTTKIEWCDETVNPLKMTCDKVSEGCQNCYSLSILKRNLPGLAIYPNHGETPVLVESEAKKPLTWKKPKMIFWQSMGDLFHERVTLQQQSIVFSYMRYAYWHTHILLTKRPGIMASALDDYFKKHATGIPDNWIIGVTAENQRRADERLPILLTIPAKNKMVSIEPMLGPVDIAPYLGFFTYTKSDGSKRGFRWRESGINWVICGAETGPRARPIFPEWTCDLMIQCLDTKTPFFFKKWGKHIRRGGPMPRQLPEFII